MRILLFLILFSCPAWMKAQHSDFYNYFNYTPRRVDSLYTLFRTTANDSFRMAAARDLGLYYIESQLDSASYFHHTQLKLARALDQPLWEADANDMLGYLETKRANFPAALEHFMEAKELAEDPATGRNVWRIRKFAADGDPDKARLTALANSTNDFGLLYQAVGDVERQLDKFRSAIAIARRIGDPIVQSYSTSNIGTLYAGMGQPDSAAHYIRLALRFSAEADFHKYDGTMYNALAQAYLQDGQLDSARHYFQASVRIGQAEDNVASMATAFVGLATLREREGMQDSAYIYGHKALSIFRKSGELAGQWSAYDLLTRHFRRADRIDSAYHYLSLASAVRDSLAGPEKIKRFERIGFQQQLKVWQLEQDRERARIRTRTLSLLAGLAVALLFAGLIYRSNRQKQKANRILEQAMQDLKAAQSQLIQSEKMASLGELTAGIAHEIQNPLNFVNNFSELNKELIEELQAEVKKGNLDEAKALAENLKENEEKINHHGKRADAIVKGMLQHSRSGSGKKEPTDLNAMVDEFVRLAYHGLRAKDKSFNARIDTDYDAGLPSVRVVPEDIGRVVLNLLNNAFYAVAEKQRTQPNDYVPAVEVRTRRTDKGVELSVRDNGNGIPESLREKIFQPFFTTKPTGQGTGLGLSLSYDIVKAHGGEIRVETQEGAGTTFCIELPI